MSELSETDKIIKDIYEDAIDGYSSIRDTFQQAVKKIQVLNILMLKHI